MKNLEKNLSLSISLDALRAGKAVSRRYRNRRIGEFLKELDLTEGRSTGIPKIIRAMTANGSPAPEFETDDDRSYYLVRLPAHLSEPDSNQVIGETEPEAQSERCSTMGEAHDEAQVDTKSVLSRDQEAQSEVEFERKTRAQSESSRAHEAQVEILILKVCEHGPKSSAEIATALGHRQLSGNLRKALPRMRDVDLLEYTIPDNPTSRLQKYRLTEKGRKILENK